MASLAQAIRSFQNGGLTHSEFFDQVERALATDQDDSAQLMEILGEEHTRILLPPDVYAELQRRIEHAVESKHPSSTEGFRLHTSPSGRLSSLGPSITNRTGNISITNRTGDGEVGTDLDRMKGVGDTLNGRFVLEECIGFGGMGTVYRALDLRKLEASDRNPYIAIKVLNVQFRGHPKSLIALQREAKKAQKLAHPNIVTVYDFDRDGATVYLTMEYLTGKPLSATLRTPDFNGLPYPQALRIITGIARALAYAHERGFVHCDLKPANVFVTDNGEVKVIDFGIARVFEKPQEDTEATVFDAGSLGGLTPAYASPEMLEHLAPDPRDDIYALGCITYELLTGHHPFNRLSALQARNAGMKLQRPKHLGHRQWRALRGALSFERKTRTPTVARFIEEMGSRHIPVGYLAAGASGLALAALVATGLDFYWKHKSVETGGQGPAEQAAAGQTAPELPETAEPQKAPPAQTAPSPPSTPQTAPMPPTASAPPPMPQTAPAPQPAQPVLPMPTVEAVAPVLARVPCSALVPSVRERAVTVRGYLPGEFGAARLKDMLSATPGVTSVNLDVQQVSSDKCDVIEMFAPYWTRNQKAANPASIHTRPRSADLTEGDSLIVDITTAGQDSFVYVDYYSLDGGVAHLVPNPVAKANQAPANYSAAIGTMGDWVIAKPFGTEFIVLLTTPAPLFDSIRPRTETKADYMRAMQKQLGQMAKKYGPDRIAVDFVQINTRAR